MQTIMVTVVSSIDSTPSEIYMSIIENELLKKFDIEQQFIPTTL